MNSIVILESEWDNDLNTTESVIPVFELFAKHNEVCICHKHYHSNKELLKWINDYIYHKDLDICYIAGHGSGKRLRAYLKTSISESWQKISLKKKNAKSVKGCTSEHAIVENILMNYLIDAIQQYRGLLDIQKLFHGLNRQ
jgi:hypothetical protein